MRFVRSLCCLIGFLLPAAFARAQAAPFTGKFSDGNLTTDWTESNGTYTGTIALGQHQFPSTAHADGQKVDGTFQAGAHSFEFTGTLAGDTLTFVSGGKTYTLAKQGPVNPLGDDAPTAATATPATATPFVTPTAATAKVGQLPAGYAVVSTTASGKALAAHKPDAKTIAAALQSTLPDLAQYFDGRPSIARAYQDTRDPNSGGMSFTANLQGQPVNGLVSCKMSDKGAAVAVLYCAANAPAGEWQKLMAPTSEGRPAAPQVQLKTYQFPDNSGSIGLAEGWTTNATSCHGMVIINGPADQAVTLGFNLSVVTPNSTSVRMNQQLNANARQLGGRPIPFTLLVAPYDTPVQAWNNLVPQLSARSQKQGAQTITIDHLKQLREIKSILPNGRAAVCSYGLTIANHGQKKHHRVLAQVEIDPVGGDSFMFALAGAAAPDATFDRDLPIMLAMMNSIRENAAVIQQQTQQQIAGMNQRFAAQQKAQKEVTDAYDDYNKDMARNSVIQSRSNDDFDEVIRGVRTVEDTQTGDKTSVNLGDVNQIVDNLNYYDPGRYKQIPLRDEADPLPPAGP